MHDRIHRIVTLAILLVGLAWLAMPAPAAAQYAKNIVLEASAAHTANGTSTAISGVYATSAFFVLEASACTGTTPTANVYIQSSFDGATVWRDMVSFTQVTTAAMTRFAQVSGIAAGAATDLAASDAALTAGTVVQGSFGDQIRVKWVIGGTGGPSCTFSVRGIFK